MSKRITVPDAIADEIQAMVTVYREMTRLRETEGEAAFNRCWEYIWDRYVRHPG